MSDHVANTLDVFRVEVEEAFSVKLFNGHRIHAGPPPGSGIILAYILRIMEGLLPAPNPSLDAHRMIEAFKYGYAERTLLGDHKFINVSEVCVVRERCHWHVNVSLQNLCTYACYRSFTKSIRIAI